MQRNDYGFSFSQNKCPKRKTKGQDIEPHIVYCTDTSYVPLQRDEAEKVLDGLLANSTTPMEQSTSHRLRTEEAVVVLVIIILVDNFQIYILFLRESKRV